MILCGNLYFLQRFQQKIFDSLLKSTYNEGMSKELIIGREHEIQQLTESCNSKESQLVIVYGRRRVGKSFLINQFFDNRFDFKLVGDNRLSKEEQLYNFYDELRRQWGKEIEVPKTWREAFFLLRDYLEAVKTNKRNVVFFDEMPWLDNQKSGFLDAFEYFWNSFGASQNNLMLIVCGSATSWLVDNFEHNKGGLFNRQNCRLYLEPFNLYETEKFLLEKKGINWSRYDICECYMILGGIPYYLDLLSKNMSPGENIDNLFFKRRGALWDEFDNLYKTLFSNSENYIKVVEALFSKKSGMNKTELLAKTKLSDNFSFTAMLRNLSDSGFIRTYCFFGNKKKGTVYQLADYFTMFYLKFVKDNYGSDEKFWTHHLDQPSRRAWAGLTFETLCKDHLEQIKKKLSIAGVSSEVSVWSRQATEEQNGAQIDLLIDRRDRIIDICEMKFSENKFVIDKDYDENLRNKISAFKEATGTRKAVQLVLVTTYGVKQNMYSSRVQGEVTMDDLFEKEK